MGSLPDPNPPPPPPQGEGAEQRLRCDPGPSSRAWRQSRCLQQARGCSELLGNAGELHLRATLQKALLPLQALGTLAGHSCPGQASAQTAGPAYTELSFHRGGGGGRAGGKATHPKAHSSGRRR